MWLKNENEMFSEKFKVSEMEQFHMSGAMGMKTRDENRESLLYEQMASEFFSLHLKSQKIQSKKKQFQGTLNTKLKGF